MAQKNLLNTFGPVTVKHFYQLKTYCVDQITVIFLFSKRTLIEQSYQGQCLVFDVD